MIPDLDTLAGVVASTIGLTWVGNVQSRRDRANQARCWRWINASPARCR